MKKCIITSLLFFVPAVAVAGDHCTNPDEYTIDRRCYVTDEQKTQKPYNAVVMVEEPDNRGFCTGVIVNEKDNGPYVLTAKHCVYSGFKTADTIKIKLENDDTEYEITKHVFGEYEGTVRTYNGDWAVYKVPENKKEDFLKISVQKANKKKSAARLVGYSALKIMNDKEIHDFKQAYIEHLKNQGKTVKFSSDDNSVLDVDLAAVVEISKKTDSGLMNDMKLKVSFCEYGKKGGECCQGWYGISGAPVFDDSDKVMAIATGGENCIGGARHAEMIKDLELKGGTIKNSVRIDDIKIPKTTEKIAP